MKNKMLLYFFKYGENIFKTNLQIPELNPCCPLCVGNYQLPMATSWLAVSPKEAQCQCCVWFKSSVESVESFCAGNIFYYNYYSFF